MKTLELKTTIAEIKNSLDGLRNGCEITDKNISKTKKKNERKISRDSETCGITSSVRTYM